MNIVEGTNANDHLHLESDHNIVFDSVSEAPKVVLTSPDSKVSLAFRTNQATVQCYTASGFDGNHSRKPEHQNGSSKGYPQFGAPPFPILRLFVPALMPELHRRHFPRIPPTSGDFSSPGICIFCRDRHDLEGGRGVREPRRGGCYDQRVRRAETFPDSQVVPKAC